MPAGIVPEIFIAIGLVLMIGLVLLVARRRPPGGTDVLQRPPAPDRAEPAAETEVVEAPAAPPEPEERVGVEAPAAEKVRPALKDRLAKSRRFLFARLSETFGGGIDDETWEDLEAVLIQADVGVDEATRIVADLRGEARARGVTDPEELRSLLVDELVRMFDSDDDRALRFADGGVTVWLVMGVNGTGKTTTIGKLARDLANHGRSVALAAADTFRAAADEQLEVWGQRTGAAIVKHQQGADPGAVAYDALQHARARQTDVLLVDTAGRLHTKTPLMDELAKIRRVIEKEGSVQEGLLVIDATSGQNGLAQAREFAEAAGVTGIVLTKLDGTAKGGIALTIERQLGIPIKLIGVGEGVDDLEPFEPKAYVDALLG